LNELKQQIRYFRTFNIYLIKKTGNIDTTIQL